MSVSEISAPERIHVRYNAADVADKFYGAGLNPECNAVYDESDIFIFLKQLIKGKRGPLFSITTCWPYGGNEDETFWRLAIDETNDDTSQIRLRNRVCPAFTAWYAPAAFQLEPERNALRQPSKIFTDRDGDLYFDLVTTTPNGRDLPIAASVDRRI